MPRGLRRKRATASVVTLFFEPARNGFECNKPHVVCRTPPAQGTWNRMLTSLLCISPAALPLLKLITCSATSSRFVLLP
jgi:hypothetical protein